MATVVGRARRSKADSLSLPLVRSTAVAGLGGLLFGFDTAVIAGTTGALTELFRLSPASLGLTVAIALWGTIAGAMLAGLPGDRYGRRDSLKVLGCLFFVSALGCAFAWNWLSFVSFRFIAGIAIEALLFLAECTSLRSRPQNGAGDSSGSSNSVSS